MAFFIEVILISAAMPACVAAITLLTKRSAGGDFIRGAIATGGAFMLVTLLLPWIPAAPERAWQWTGYLAAGAGLVSALGGKHWLAHVAAVGVCIAAGWLLVPTYESTADSIVLYRILTGVTVGLIWWSLELMADHAEPTPTGWLWLAILLAGAAVLERAGIAKFTQLMAALAASVGTLALIGTFIPLGRALRGAAGPVAIVLTGLAINGYVETFLGVPLVSFLLIVLTPTALGLTALPRFTKRPARQMMWLRIGIAGVMLGTAAGLAWAG